MTKVECENIIIEKLKEIMDSYHEYNPEGKTLHLYVTGDHYSVSNNYYDADREKPLTAWVEDDYDEIYHNTPEEGREQ